MFGVKLPIPRELRAGVVYKFLCACVRALPPKSTKPTGILPNAYVSTCSVIRPLSFLDTYKVLSNAALHDVMIVT